MKVPFPTLFTRLLLLLLLVGFQATAQTSPTCDVVGWATQNGGTTGGGSATPVVVTNYTELKNAVTSTTVKVVHISGRIVFPSAGRISFQDQTGKTIYGLAGSSLVSSDLTATGSGILYMKRCNNIIIKNVTFEGPGAYDTGGHDNLTIEQCSNVWVDHCDFQDGIDGNLDVKNQADYISITWCRFVYLKPPIAGGSGGAADHRFSNLFGSSDGATTDRGKLRITMQNCWWAQGCRERMPRVRFGKVHIVNNYFSSAGNNHCIRAGYEADLRVESNYFENVNKPIDLFENNFTAVSALNNVFVNTVGNTAGSGTAFTPPYSLTVTPAADVKAQVTNSTCGAGATLSSPSGCCGTTTPTSYTLTTTASPTAGGTIARSPNASSYAAGTVVTLTATPASGYSFTGWSGAASGTSATTTVTMNANSTVTATFTATSTTSYTLTTTASPAAGGTIARSPDAASYAPNTVVTVTATPATGYTFTGWSGASTATTASTSVTMDASKALTANFTASSGGTSTLRIEDAATASGGYCGADGSRQNSYTGADNGYYINLSNSSGQGVNYSVSVPAAGAYTLRFRYANGGSKSATTARVLVNGVSAVASVPFPKTSSWSTWTTTTASVSLPAGVSAIRLETTVASEFANIDWLEVTGSSPTAAACSSSRTAAPATLAEATAAEAARAEATQPASQAARLYPNPTTDRAVVAFALAERSLVSVRVYNSMGLCVRTLVEKAYPAGAQDVSISAAGLKPGVYTVVVNTGKRKQSLRMEVR